MQKIITIVIWSAVLIISISAVTGCNSGLTTPAPTDTTAATSIASTVPTTTATTTTPTVATTSTISATDAAILVYADPATEILLQGLSEDNLAKYVQYGDDVFKAAVTQALLDSISTSLKNQYGIYISKQFIKTTITQGYISVYYVAKFTNGTLNIQMTFDSNHLVAGQYFVQ